MMFLRELVFAGLVAGSIVPGAAARDAAELQCVHEKATPEDAKTAYDATLSGEADALIDRLDKLMLANIACLDQRGLNEHVGEIAGDYISAALVNDHLQLQLGSVPNALSILDDALAKLTDEQKARIPGNMTEADKAWLVQTATAAGLAEDQTRFMQARLYIVCRVKMSHDLAEWRAL
jgi:hypothetical protein